ncbi:Pycsar system effector family protein [Streptomyces sp. NPDC002701]|uniref:Pycsar system effector family protein n=1 Tax=Streptomyces sp. NPDC002701 TaxID=3364661 RepID=UPI00368721A9
MSSDDPDAAAHFVAERLLLTVREDLGRADLKASILLSGAVAVPALVLGRGVPSGTSDLALGFLAAGGGLWAGGALLLLAVIVPRTGTVRSVPGPTFYADALTATDPQALRRAVAEAGADRVGWLLAQFQDASVILSAKYRWLRRSMALLGAGLLLAALAPAMG